MFNFLAFSFICWSAIALQGCVCAVQHCQSAVLFSCSVAQSCLFVTPWTAAGLVPLSSPLSPDRCSYLTVLSSALPSPPAFRSLGSFLRSWLSASGGRSIGSSASATVLPMNTQDWSPLGWTGWISLQSKGLSRVFSNTTVQKHQFFSAQPSLWSTSHIHTWLLEKP